MGLFVLNTKLNKKVSHGFTLTELIVTVGLIVLLVNLTVPVGDMVDKVTLDYVNQRVYSSVVLAKSEAIKRSGTVSICRSTKGVSCEFGVNWADGWVVFVNSNANDELEPDEEVIQVYNKLKSKTKLSFDGGDMISFQSNGRSIAESAFTLCSLLNESIAARQVSISKSGLVRKQEGGSC